MARLEGPARGPRGLFLPGPSLPDGAVGILYEAGERRYSDRIVFARFTLEWLTDGRDSLAK